MPATTSPLLRRLATSKSTLSTIKQIAITHVYDTDQQAVIDWNKALTNEIAKKRKEVK